MLEGGVSGQGAAMGTKCFGQRSGDGSAGWGMEGRRVGTGQ